MKSSETTKPTEFGLPYLLASIRSDYQSLIEEVGEEEAKKLINDLII